MDKENVISAAVIRALAKAEEIERLQEELDQYFASMVADIRTIERILKIDKEGQNTRDV